VEEKPKKAKKKLSRKGKRVRVIPPFEWEKNT
jgi:hypothetical protein